MVLWVCDQIGEIMKKGDVFQRPLNGRPYPRDDSHNPKHRQDHSPGSGSAHRKEGCVCSQRLHLYAPAHHNAHSQHIERRLFS
jgi:hypothetical protein